jgi:hypothetical protein
MASWFEGFLSALEREYERRLRRASGLDTPSAAPDDDDDEGTIVNLAPGAQISEVADEDGAAEIVNMPRG